VVQDLLRRRQRLTVEGEDAAHETGDEVIQLGVGDCVVDPPVPLRGGGIEVIGSHDDLDCARASDHERQPRASVSESQ
jgi:hypothetical protein